MIALSYLLLAAAASFFCFWLWPRRQRCRAGARGAITATLVALVLVILSSGLHVLGLAGVSNDGIEHSQRIIGLSAQVMTLPLFGLACFYLAHNLQWSPPTWAKIILGLMAFFELSRYLEQQIAYQWLVNLIGIAALLAACVISWPRQRLVSLLGAVTVVSVLLPAWFANQVPLSALMDASAHASWLLPGLAALSLMVGLLAEQAHNRESTLAADNREE
ncbi:MAG: hypothetical protein M1440_04475 [Gammaproteobacteria bacterium]|nr:hypothetical protein [Gammaproteobacteria bacterium]